MWKPISSFGFVYFVILLINIYLVSFSGRGRRDLAFLCPRAVTLSVDGTHRENVAGSYYMTYVYGRLFGVFHFFFFFNLFNPVGNTAYLF